MNISYIHKQTAPHYGHVWLNWVVLVTQVTLLTSGKTCCKHQAVQFRVPFNTYNVLQLIFHRGNPNMFRQLRLENGLFEKQKITILLRN